MTQAEPPVRWSPRVRPERIRQLYLTDARGIVDPELIEDVGWALYARCQSILAVSAAAAGAVECPQCGRVIQRQTRADGEVLACVGGGWQTTWARYHRTWRHQELYGGGAVDMFRAFVAEWRRASTPQRQMLLIDQLIHAWHWQTRADRQLGRPVGVNLIEGSRKQVLALLDGLSYGSGNTPGTQETRDAWHATWQRVRAAQQESR